MSSAAESSSMPRGALPLGLRGAIDDTPNQLIDQLTCVHGNAAGDGAGAMKTLLTCKGGLR